MSSPICATRGLITDEELQSPEGDAPRRLNPTWRPSARFEHDHRYLPVGSRLVDVVPALVDLVGPPPDARPLVAFGDARPHRYPFAADLDLDVGVRGEVVEPARVLRVAA